MGDTFRLSNEQKVERAKERARESIIETLKEEGVERGIIINGGGEIVCDAKGEPHSVSYGNVKLTNASHDLHGHSRYNQLSTVDIAFLLGHKIKSIEAVMRNGHYSRLTKGEHFSSPGKSGNLLASELSSELLEKVFDRLGINYEIKPQDVLDIYRQYKKDLKPCETGEMTDDEVKEELEKKYRIDYNSQDAPKQLREKLSYDLRMKGFGYDGYDKMYGRHAIVNRLYKENEERIEEFYQTEDYFKMKTKFIEDVAKKYGLIYETNMSYDARI